MKEGQSLRLASVIRRKKNKYYRMLLGRNQFVWASQRQVSKYFEPNCEGGSLSQAGSQEDASAYSESLQDLEDSMEDPDQATSGEDLGSVEEQASATEAMVVKSRWGGLLGMGIGTNADYLNDFIDVINNPNNVKEDPDPIIVGTEKGQAIFAQAFYERNLFKPQILWRLGVAYRFESFQLLTKKNPASGSSIIRLDSLENGVIDVDVSVLEFKTAFSYRHTLLGLDLRTGLGLGVNYFLNGEIVIDRRIGGLKTTEASTVLSLNELQYSVEPLLEWHLKMGAFLGARYRYILGESGGLGFYLGYSF